MLKSFACLITLLFAFSLSAQQKQLKAYTIAFYNVENLFDTINDPGTGDDDFLSGGRMAWTGAKYRQKLANVARVIADIGTEEKVGVPVVIGLCEVENRRVLEDLIRQPALLERDYGIVHFDSPDSRGTDVALLYSKKHFRPSSSKNIPLMIKDTISQKEGKTGKKKKPKGELFTRDQLLVTGYLAEEEVHFIINHWPSRYGGEKKSRPNRIAAAALNKAIVDSLYRKNPQAKIISMGDFNDGPYNESVGRVLGAEVEEQDVKAGGLFNPMARLWKLGGGTTTFKDKWELFDQMVISEPLLGIDYTSLRFHRMNIFSRDYMITPSGKYKAYPLRNGNGEAGYSDHFPVYLTLVKYIEKGG